MKLTENLYFYEGDYVDKSRTSYYTPYRGMSSSNFLILKGEKQVLIDSGMEDGPHRKRTLSQIKQDGLCLDESRIALFSHSHPDHILLAKKLSLKNKMQFLLHEDNREIIKSQEYFFEAFFNYPDYIKNELFVVPTWFFKLCMRGIGMDFRYLKVHRYIKDHEVLDLGMEIRVIPMPSHCPGHVGFYFPKEKLFYSGDLFDFRCAEGIVLMAANSSFEKAFQDIELVRNLDIEVLIPGHGIPIRGRDQVLRTLDRVKAGTAGYRDNILKVLPKDAQKGLCIADITKNIFKNTISYNALSRRTIVYNTLHYLYNTGMTDCIIKNGKSYWFTTQS